MVNAISKSNILEMNEDKSMVRRRIPFKEEEISSGFGFSFSSFIDRIIYVENLSTYWDQEKVKEIFQNFGTVTYVSLPRDKTTKSFKKYGFIEFATGI